jgi:fructokinase
LEKSSFCLAFWALGFEFATRREQELKLLALGEILWDVFDDSEILGGAPLNFSVAAQRLGNTVALLTAIGADSRGERALESMSALGVSKDFVQILPGRDTGTARVTTDESGNPSFFIKRPAAFDAIQFERLRMSAIEALAPEWIYFGTLAQMNPSTESVLRHLLTHFPTARCFYDVNLRDGHWTLPLVERLSGLASIVKLNESEAMTLFELTHPVTLFSLKDFCSYWTSAFEVETMCVTLGSRGCAVFHKGTLHCSAGFEVKLVDTVGSGDAFAAGFLHGYELKWTMEQTLTFANALGALVASRSGATPPWTATECWHLIAKNRSIEAQSVAEQSA